MQTTLTIFVYAILCPLYLLPALYIGIMLRHILGHKMKPRFSRKRSLWLLVLLSILIPPVSWYKVSMSLLSTSVRSRLLRTICSILTALYLVQWMLAIGSNIYYIGFIRNHLSVPLIVPMVLILFAEIVPLTLLINMLCTVRTAVSGCSERGSDLNKDGSPLERAR